MLKLYITAIDSREDGTAVTLFEDYQINYEDKYMVGLDDNVGKSIFGKIEEVEKINDQVTSPF